jgi:periplasmic protein TonB
MASSAKINAHAPQAPPAPPEEPKPKTPPENAASPHPAFAFHAAQEQARRSSRLGREFSWVVPAAITVAVVFMAILFWWNINLSDRISAQERISLDLRLKNQKLSDQLDSILLVSELKSTTDSLGTRVGTAEQEFDSKTAELRQRALQAGNPPSSLAPSNPFNAAPRAFSRQTSTVNPAPAAPLVQDRRPSPSPFRDNAGANLSRPAQQASVATGNTAPNAASNAAPSAAPNASPNAAPNASPNAAPNASPNVAPNTTSRILPQRETPAPEKALGMASLGSGSAGSMPNGLLTGTAPLSVTRAPQAKKLVISSGVMNGYRLSGAAPQYPSIAKSSNVQGSVVLAASISKIGTIENLRVVRGPLMLQSAALAAVRTWRYKPYMLNGEPVSVDTTINVVFQMVAR